VLHSGLRAVDDACITIEGIRATLIDLLGYTGAALALTGTIIALGESGTAAQVAAGSIVTAALIAAGWLVGGIGAQDPQHRMRSIFWALALLSWSQVAVVVLGPDGIDLDGKWLVAGAGLLVVGIAVPLWRIEQRSLQLIGAFVGIWVTVAALFYAEDSLFGAPVPNVRWSAIATLLLGLAALVAGAREMVAPRRTAMVLGSLAFIYGTTASTLEVLSGTSNVSIVLALIASAIVLYAGERTSVIAVTGIGIVGVGSGVLQLVIENVHAESGGLAVLVLGVVMLGATIYLVRAAGGDPRMPEPPA